MILTCVSDTHWYPLGVEIPDGDVLIHAGDLTLKGSEMQLIEAGAWLRSLPHKHKLVVPGNHELLLERNQGWGSHLLGDGEDGIQVLIDKEVTIDGVKFFGSPWSSEFGDWAFGARPGGHSWAVYGRIPVGTDVLISHGPPKGIRDFVAGRYSPGYLGNPELLKRVMEVKPKVHVFGHIHGGYGQEEHEGIKFVNAAICDELYDHVNLPQVIEI